MQLVDRNVWVLFIIVTVFNAVIFRSRSRTYIARDPSLRAGYKKLFVGMLVWGNVPWVIMGLGCLFGRVPSVLHYFRPRDGHPFVLAFFISIFVIWFLGTYWVLARGGAEMMVRHPGLFGWEVRRPWLVKVLWCLSVAAGLTAAVQMFLDDTLMPNLAP